MINTILLGIVIVFIICFIILKKRTRIVRFIKKHQIIRFIANVMLPFIVPLALSIIFVQADDKLIDSIKGNKSILTVVILLISMAIINLVVQFYFWIREKKESDIRWENFAAKHAYNNLYEIHMNKNSQLRSAYHNGLTRGMLTDADIPYNLFEHIRKITWEFCNTISKITDIPTKDLDASFIYHYDYPEATKADQKWRWVTGKGSKFNYALNDYVDETDSVFHYMIHNHVSTLFYNDKSVAVKDRRYQFSYKDYSHDCTGSFVAARVAFSGNDNQLCEGIIMVNSYGKKFLDSSPRYTEKELSHLILDSIFPVYRNLLTTELAMLYFRHQGESTEDPYEMCCCKKNHKTWFRSQFNRYKNRFKCIIAINKKIWVKKN